MNNHIFKKLAGSDKYKKNLQELRRTVSKNFHVYRLITQNANASGVVGELWLVQTFTRRQNSKPAVLNITSPLIIDQRFTFKI